MNGNIKVSVIVPIYNVEEYLRECLDSLVKQTLKEIEVIMIDDGSQDLSGKIAKEYEIKYSNFKLITQKNGGLGKARNVGLKYVKGNYIAFIDSDDYISIYAYEKMYNAAIKDDCDIVIGNVKRFNSKKVYASGLHKKVFKENIENTNIYINPELIYDTTAWNKLFKFEFWQKNQFKFPEDILYEDIPVTIPAHFLSNSTTILEDVVYYWRERDGLNTSITQNRSDIKNFLDRLKVLKLVDKFYENNVVDEKASNNRFFKWLDLDFMLYINQLDKVDKDYTMIFMKEIREYIQVIPNKVFNNLKAIDKIKYYLIQQNNIDKLIEVIEYQKNKFKYLKVIENKNRYYGEFPFKSIPKLYFDMTDELNIAKVSSKIENIKWNGNIMKISGFMYLPRVNIKSKGDIRLTAKLVNINTGKYVSIEIDNYKRKDVTYKFGIKNDNGILNDRIYNYNWSGFKINIDFSNKAILDIANIETGNLKILINFEINGMIKEFYLNGPVTGNKSRPKPYLTNYQIMKVKYNAAWEIIISYITKHAGMTQIYTKDNNIYLEGWLYDSRKIKELVLLEKTTDTEIKIRIDIDENKQTNKIIKQKYPKSKVFNLEIPLDYLEKNIEYLNAYLYYKINKDRQCLCGNITNTKNIISRNNKTLRIQSGLDATILFVYSKIKSYLDNLKWNDDRLEITIAVNKELFNDKDDIKKITLKSQSENLKSIIYSQYIDYEVIDDIVKIRFKLYTKNENSTNKYASDIWINYIEYSFNNEIIEELITCNNIDKSSKKIFKTHEYIPFRTQNGNFAIKVNLKWSWLEKGPRRREFIEKNIYPIFRKIPLNKKRIVFESLWGNKYYCNPRALYEYIDKNEKGYKCIWIFNDESIQIEGRGKKVRKGTLKYYYYMATSKFFVNNVNFPDFYEKRNNVVEIQTMHGTPLKTLGLDVPGDFPTQDHIDRFLKRCRRWDYLLVQSDEVANITKSCYAFEKEYLKVGYPRNDILFSKNKEEIINQVKEELNISKNKKVILYAPTWRIKNKFDMKLDLENMKNKLGDEYVLLLRVHPLAIKGLDTNIFNDFIKNVSDYEYVEKLFLITDILITDYSSIMFDFAILNKPILFFTYDLDLYKNNLRGFNLDIQLEAPGPLLYTCDEVINSIENIDDVFEKSKIRVDLFREKFCQYETGNASNQIVDKIFKNKI